MTVYSFRSGQGKGVHKGGRKTPMKIQIRPILMKFKPYVLHTTVREISGFSTPFVNRKVAQKGGRRHPRKFKYVQFWLNLNHAYYILSKGDFQNFQLLSPGSKGGLKTEREAQGAPKTPMKIQISPISMKFMPYLIHLIYKTQSLSVCLSVCLCLSVRYRNKTVDI